MDLKTYLSSLNTEERQAFLARCDTSIGTMRNVIGGKRCGPNLAVRIEVHSGGKVTRKELRPNDYATIWPELAGGVRRARRSLAEHPQAAEAKAGAQMKRGRKPGALVNARCKLCGTIELATGSGSAFRCTACKRAGLRISTVKSVWDRPVVQSIVQTAIRDGHLMPARGMRCTDCGGVACDYDHRDYNKPLQVEPVCRKCNLLRGPAIPRHGTFHLLVEQGYIPYVHLARVRKLFALMGLPQEALIGMPGRLTNAHWQGLVHLFPQTPSA